MHDFLFDHVHLDPNETDAVDDAIWAADNLELTTVGIDIGSSTSHLMFARLHMRRLASGLSSRFVTVKRDILWRSPILLTPYRNDTLIDAQALGHFVRKSYADAGLARGDVDSGAVILTGVALTRPNARAIADLFADEAGKFVCASAGHHLEATMAAHGSGTVALSRRRGITALNVDIGGGTSKFSLVENGIVIATAAIAIGGRLLVTDAQDRVLRVEEPIRKIARSLNVDLVVGDVLTAGRRWSLANRMAHWLVDILAGAPLDATARDLLVTAPLPPRPAWLAAVTFSGGVAEFMFGRETQHFGDLGPDLARALQDVLAHRAINVPVWDPGQGIRATVTGAAQFTVQVSGSTILVSAPDRLPLRNLPVVSCWFAGPIDSGTVAQAIGAALERSDLTDGVQPVALAFAWKGDPLYADLYAVAAGICAALPRTLASPTGLVLLIDGDIGMTLGRIVTTEVAPGAAVVAIDGVQLAEFDYVDIGAIAQPANVVPVIIKSLVF
jgi:ethanolamine utilization protein EutA